MFTLKFFPYQPSQSISTNAEYSCLATRRFSVQNHEKGVVIHMDDHPSEVVGCGAKVIVENADGKTIDVIRPNRAPG